jgi:hypothetical protein
LAQVLSFEKPALQQPPFPYNYPLLFVIPSEAEGSAVRSIGNQAQLEASLCSLYSERGRGKPGAGCWQMLFGAFRPQAIRIFGKTCALSALSALSGVSDDQDSQVHTRLDHIPGLKVSVLARLTASGRPSGLSHRTLSRSGIGKLKKSQPPSEAEESAVPRNFRGNVFLESAPEWRDLRLLPEPGSYNEPVDIRLWSPKIYPWNVPPTY